MDEQDGARHFICAVNAVISRSLPPISEGGVELAYFGVGAYERAFVLPE